MSKNSCQKATKMSTSAPASSFKICHFESSFLPLQPYFCYSNEICCKEGCCSPYEYKYFKSWHFWYKIYLVLGILIFFLLYRYMRWHCRKIRDEDGLDDDVVNQHSVNLMLRYHNRRNESTNVPKDDDRNDPPPLYSVAINLPKPNQQDEVPTYEQATAQNH